MAEIGSTICKSSDMSFVKRVEIRWRDMDGFGHVNNAVFLTYLEEARDELFTGLLGDVTHRMVLRHTTVDFRSGLVQADDLVDVSLDVVRIGSSSVTTRETITAVSDARIAAIAESVMVHCDEARLAASPLPDASRRLLEGILCPP
ncbi:MAG: acyl-CoA thioester hydrolase [Microbacteriaceae bacterium]|nr:acyl-CoA thioester hydrolase [Microbacteriaceae bacterium]